MDPKLIVSIFYRLLSWYKYFAFGFKMYPETKYLKIPMLCCISIGMFPREFMFEKNQHFRSYYANYSKLMFGLYILYTLTMYIKIYELLRSDDLRLDEISGVLCTCLLYTITFIRQLIIRFHSGLRSIIKEIIVSENIIIAQSNKVTYIYNDCVRNASRFCIIYPVTIYLITSLYMLRPLVIPGYEKHIGNQTVYIKALPIVAWFPADEQVYYKAAYTCQVLTSYLGAAFVSYTDTLTFSLIVYSTVQLKIMKYVLRNFEMYKERIQNQLKIDDDMAAFVTFRECIIHHRNVIRYVDYFNDSMNILMTFDFLQSSLQIATVLAQVLGNEISLILIICVGSYVTGMLLRLTMYYYYANEVILLSSDLAVGVWDINWYDQPPNVKFMMFIFMLRAQKSLKLQIGPFAVMSLDSLIAILKTTYSYITLIYGTN